MATTIQISKNLHEELKERKFTDSETYEEVLWNLLEDVIEISKETKKMLHQAETDIKAGRVHSFDKVKSELNV